MLIKENSNVVTLRLIKNYLKEEVERLEKRWEETAEDQELFTDHCIVIGKLDAYREMQKFMDEIFVVNE